MKNTKKKTRIYLNGYFKFGFIEAMDKVRFECVICGERLANESMKPCKLRRHQSTKHPHTVGKPREFFLRKKELVISNRPQNTRDALTRAGNENRQATVASFECALLIAQSKKPHTIGETLLKPTSVKMTEILCSIVYCAHMWLPNLKLYLCPIIQ